MSNPSSREQTQVEVAGLSQVGRVTDRFRSAWQSGQRPRIEEFLGEAPPSCRDVLLASLLEIELSFRSRSGESLELEEYRRRFPEDVNQIETAFRGVAKAVRLGDYELFEPLGEGGMGVIYRARQVFLNQIVAVKVLPERYLEEPQAIARFQREMQSIGGLDHPNIVRAFNAGEAQGRHFLVMEYVDGVNLQQLMADRTAEGLGPLSVGAACEAIRQASLGLQHAHEHGLVHRDIKPANLMLSRFGAVKLLDLGLARIHADRPPVDPQLGPLTQAGTTMGTVDYMAPEQWENASAVDIRADVYSLGCTLFFLLAGRPPYGDKPYDSNRKKLMAHVVAPVPSLAGICPKHVEDLDRIVAHLMAKEPDDRFDTPGEVADAVGLFAVKDELLACIPAREEAASTRIPSKPEITRVQVETSKKVPRPSGRKKEAAGAAGRPRPWAHVAVAAAICAAAIVLAGLAAWAAARFLANPLSRARRAQLAWELGTLPGLNGGWWFDETPWYVPFVREAITARLGDRNEALRLLGPEAADRNPALDSGVGTAHRWLLGEAQGVEDGLTGAQRELLQGLFDLSQQDLEDAKLAERLAGLAKAYREAVESADPAAATDLHTLAVLEHKIAFITGDSAARQGAVRSYEAARAAYESQGERLAPLRSLLLLDLGRLYALTLPDFAKAQACCRAAREPAEAPVLVRAESLVNEAIAGRVSDPEVDTKYVTAGNLLKQAADLLEASDLGRSRPQHPFLAHVHERYAWVLMDEWDVRKAEKHFQAAHDIRYDNRADNAWSQVFVLHNRHGTTMALRYFGDVGACRHHYGSLVADVEKALGETATRADVVSRQRLCRDLRERLSNSLERQADCDLYQGDRAQPPDRMLEAADLYERARGKADDLGARTAMAYKRCLALALAGRVEQARDEIARDRLDRQPTAGRDQERVSLLRRLAPAVLAFKEAKSDRRSGHEALRGFLSSFNDDPNYPDRHRRETQEMQLLAAELLVASELEDPGTLKEARSDVDLYLDPLIKAFPLPKRKEMLPYLRRYYDLMIEATAAANPTRAANYVLASRDAQRVAGTATLVFHFQRGKGTAIFEAPSAPAAVFPLDFGRDQIRQARAKDAGKLRLPPKLVEIVQAEQSGGRKVVAYWSDAESWPTEDGALSDAQWPFEGQLDLSSLRPR